MEKDTTQPGRISRRGVIATLALLPPFVLGLTASENAFQARAGARINLAMLSFWHVHAREYEHQALDQSVTDIVAVWDEIADRGQTQARMLGVPFYEHLSELLAHPGIDGVIVDVPTTMHRDVMVAAAQAGKHIFTEKVLAPTLHECNEIVAAVEKAGVKLMVSLPQLYTGSTLAIRNILDRKLLGELTGVRTRLFHDGALRTTLNPQGWLPSHFFDPRQTAGGAMIDLGAHPMYLARTLLGLPESVSATFGYVTGRAVEDNAVAVLQYANGAIGIAEAGFVNHLSPATIEVFGTDGSLFYGTPEGIIQLRSMRAGRAYADHWGIWKDIPPDQPLALQQWISHIQHGTTASENIQIAVDLSMLMEAANLSVKKQQPVRLDSLVR